MDKADFLQAFGSADNHLFDGNPESQSFNIPDSIDHSEFTTDTFQHTLEPYASFPSVEEPNLIFNSVYHWLSTSQGFQQDHVDSSVVPYKYTYPSTRASQATTSLDIERIPYGVATDATQNWDHSANTFGASSKSLTFAKDQHPNKPFTWAKIPNDLENDFDFSVARQTPSYRLGCIRCRSWRVKCEVNLTSDPRCHKCILCEIPQSLCIRERIVDRQPFKKWLNQAYVDLFTYVNPSESGPWRKVELGHYLTKNAPSLNVECYEFIPSRPTQYRALKKNASGWHSVDTTSWCVANSSSVDLTSYIDKCTVIALKEACDRQDRVAFFFKLARLYCKESVICNCLRLYTTLRLMRIGWHFVGDETLGMDAVKERTSAWFGEKPVPRMIANQLGHMLELKMYDLEKEILKAIQQTMHKRRRTDWMTGFLAIFLLLHIREVDAGRNIFWKRYSDMGGFWIHPSKPGTLIEDAVASCNSLLMYFHCVLKSDPFEMDWDLKESQAMVGNVLEIVHHMKLLQTEVRKLREDGSIGRKACNVYKDGDPDSVALTMSSLLFLEEGVKTEIKGFY